MMKTVCPRPSKGLSSNTPNSEVWTRKRLPPSLIMVTSQVLSPHHPCLPLFDPHPHTWTAPLLRQGQRLLSFIRLLSIVILSTNNDCIKRIPSFRSDSPVHPTQTRRFLHPRLTLLVEKRWAAVGLRLGLACSRRCHFHCIHHLFTISNTTSLPLTTQRVR